MRDEPSELDPDIGARRPRGRTLALRVGVALVSLAIGAGVVELAVRAALDVYRCDPQMGWTFQHDRSGLKLNRETNSLNTVQLNRHGFRGPDRELEKPAGVHRTLVLGDSFTAGLHVAQADSYPARLEENLNRKNKAGTRFEIINAGVPGYSTAQELAFFREIGWKHNPDLVVLALYLGNDISNNSLRAIPCHYLVSVCGRPYYEMREGRLVSIDEGRPQRVQSESWLDRLLGFSLVYRNLIQRSTMPVSNEAPEGQVVYGIESKTRGFPAWVTTMELLLQIKEAVELYRIPFVVLVASTQPEVVVSPMTGSMRLLRLELLSFLEHHGIAYVEPLRGLLESQEDGRSPYYEGDHHWNEVGHAIAANAIDAFFVQHCGAFGLPIEGCTSRDSTQNALQ